MPVQSEETEDYKTKYKNLKRKLKILIYENECFQEELQSANRALLRVKQDKSFLLDQLLPYNQQPVSSSDSDLTDNSDNEASVSHKRKREACDSVSGSSYLAAGSVTSNISNSRAPIAAGSAVNSTAGAVASKAGKIGYHGSAAAGSTLAKKRPSPHSPALSRSTAAKQSCRGRQRRPPTKLASKASGVAQIGEASLSSVSTAASVVETTELSREEVERHLLARQPIADFNTPVSLTLPHQLFSDNIMDGELLGEEIETSPSNVEEDITVDNYDD